MLEQLNKIKMNNLYKILFWKAFLSKMLGMLLCIKYLQNNIMSKNTFNYNRHYTVFS